MELVEEGEITTNWTAYRKRNLRWIDPSS